MINNKLDDKIRYEILKEHNFTCQCCGRPAPYVPLFPFKEKGVGYVLCHNCYQGKIQAEDAYVVKNSLSSKDLTLIQRRQANDRFTWYSIPGEVNETMIDNACSYIQRRIKDIPLTKDERAIIRSLFDKYYFEEIMTAIDISCRQYWDGTKEGFDKIFSKLPGICYNRKAAASDRRGLYFFKLKKEAKTKFGIYDEDAIRDFVWGYLLPFDEAKFQQMLKLMRNAKTWNEWKTTVWSILVKEPPKDQKEGNSINTTKTLGKLKGSDNKTYEIFQDESGQITAKGNGKEITNPNDLQKLFG